MAFKGTNKRNALQISEEIEDVGGQSNAYTSREFTAFYCKMLKGDTELAVDVLTDILQNSTFPEDELVKEREVVVQEIKQTIDTPDDIVFDYFQETAFPDQAIGRSILGSKENVRSFTREKLNNYIATNYAAENIIVCAVGNIEHNAFVNMVESRMGGFRSKTNFTPDRQHYEGGFLWNRETLNKCMSPWDSKVSDIVRKTIIRASCFQRCSAAECPRACFRKSVKKRFGLHGLQLYGLAHRRRSVRHLCRNRCQGFEKPVAGSR